MSLNPISISKMGEVYARVASYFVFILFILAGKATCRHLSYDADESVSDGVSDGGGAQEQESFVHIKEMDYVDDHCELMYGFLPCSCNIASHIFLIVIYEYLLYHGESYAGGDGRIFRVFGKNLYVSMFFPLLDSLPESLILLVTGLTTSEEKAQDYVVTGAGLLTGSSILLLTLLWGVCFICARTKLVKDHRATLLTGGVITDEETKYHAKLMFFSLIPFVFILLPDMFGSSYSSEECKSVLVLSFFVSVICLFSYFYYQSYDPMILKRRLDYAELEQKVEMHVPFYKVQALMFDREKHLIVKQKEMEQWIHSQPNNDTEKFYDKFKGWIDETRQLMDDPYSLDKSGTKYNQVAELLLEDKIKFMRLIDSLLKKKLFKEDRALDESSIIKVFELIDKDQDKSITRSELKEYFLALDEVLIDEEMVEIMMRHLDNDKNGYIDQKEFIYGITKCLNEIELNNQKHSQARNRATNNNQNTNKFQRGEAKAKAKEKFHAITLLMVGVFMLTVLAEPLVESVRKFSKSINMEPFYASFILVPMATNARTAFAAIRDAKQKKQITISLTFSEIYHKVLMNNILGFFVLVSVIYFRRLTWNFSAEIIVVFIVCIIMGLLTSFISKFPIWTLFIAFPLYPLSLVMVYFFADTVRIT